MENILEELLTLPGAQGAFVVGRDGLPIASAGETDADSETLGAATAELVSHLETTFKNRGALNIFEYTGEKGNCFLASINEVTYLYLQTLSSTTTGRVRLALKSACQQLREQL